MKSRFVVLLGLYLCISINSTSAQIDRSGRRDQQDSSAQSDSTDTKSTLPDTLVLQYFKMDDITKLYEYKDSTLDNYYHQYDPAKRRDIDYLNLGNSGSAARSMIYMSAPYIGYSSGLNQYDLYNLELDDFRFLENNVPFSDVSFSPLASQQNFVIKSDFSKSFSDGTSLSINYDRIRQVGFYTNQLTKITNFGGSLRYKSKNERYTGFLSMISNIAEEQNNGGIVTDTLFGKSLYNNRLDIPVMSDDAQTRHQQKLYSLINYYALNQPKKNKIQLLLRYDLTVDNRYQKFTDNDVSTKQDSINYGQFRKEHRGIRFYNKEYRIRNAFYAYASDGDRLNIRTGIIYDRYDIDQQGLESEFDNLFLDFKGDLPIGNTLAIKTAGQIGLLDGAGDFKAKGSLNLNVGKWINLNGGVSFYRYTPSLINRSLVLNGDNYWINDFTKPVGTDIFGSFEIPKINLKGKISQSVVNNSIYWDSTATPIQYDDVLSVTTLTMSHNLKVGKIGFENYVLFQVFSENIYNLPTLYSKHNIYVQGKLFKGVLLSRLGAEIRLNPSYIGAEYSPVIGSFYRSNERLDFYPMTDIYITGKIEKFRFFLKMENVVSFLKNEVQFQTINHPQFDHKLRFGVRWVLLD
ncbi:MAG: putative porin [Saprospiraceae bacterium]